MLRNEASSQLCITSLLIEEDASLSLSMTKVFKTHKIKNPVHEPGFLLE
ncbi:hypothetical protein ACEN9X_16940 [Mucilaginibacter sp. Mucisp86]